MTRLEMRLLRHAGELRFRKMLEDWGWVYESSYSLRVEAIRTVPLSWAEGFPHDAPLLIGQRVVITDRREYLLGGEIHLTRTGNFDLVAFEERFTGRKFIIVVPVFFFRGGGR